MKFRVDFVTNSSSSSFVSVHISGSKLMEILNKYRQILETEEYNRYGRRLEITKDEFSYSENEDGDYYVPESKQEVAKSFINIISKLSMDSDNPEEMDLLIKELRDNEKEINKTLTSLYWNRVDTGWGGDDESRLWHDYDDGFILDYMDLDEETEITEEIRDQFMVLVAEATGQETRTAIYKGKKFVKDYLFELI